MTLKIKKGFILEYLTILIVGIFVFTIPFEAIQLIKGLPVSITRYFGLICGIFLIIRSIIKRSIVKPNFTVILWGGFIFLGVLCIIWAISPEVVISSLSTYIMLFLLYLIFSVSIFNEMEIKYIKLFIIIGGIIAAIFTILIFWQLGFSGRATLTIGEYEANPNEFGFNLLLPIALLFEIYLAKFNKKKIFFKMSIILSLIILIFGILITMSRAAAFAMIILFIFLIFKQKEKKWFIIAILLVLIIMSFLLPSLFFQRFSEIVPSRAGERIDIWIVGLNSLRDNWLLGAGLGNYKIVYSKYAIEAPVYSGEEAYHHNAYLGVLVELGIIGFVLFIIFLFSNYKIIKNLRKKFNILPIEGCFYGMLAYGFFGGLLTKKSFWLLLILIIIYYNLKNRVRQ